MTRIFIADDHAIVRQGLRRLLGVTPDLEFAGEAADGWQVLDKLDQDPGDLLVLDMSLPGPNGVELIRTVKERQPELPVLVLTIHSDTQIVASALKAGANGYLTKDSEPDMIITAIRQCVSGGCYVDPELGARMLIAGNTRKEVLHEALSTREHQVFVLLAQGMSINAISDKLHISPKTVSTHKFRIMQKLEIDTVTDLVRYAIRHRLIEP
tara:strand:- start:12040 stop:12672 length:633 start_codon:yes stop_codon:yes gene_type:complete